MFNSVVDIAYDEDGLMRWKAIARWVLIAFVLMLAFVIAIQSTTKTGPLDVFAARGLDASPYLLAVGGVAIAVGLFWAVRSKRR